MGYIYKITNDINGKLYIGMTESDDAGNRWKEHLSSYQTAWKRTKRPLYEAMNKYGIEHFHFEVIEETDSPIEREQYWIDKLRTYIGFKDCNGYNATLGGESHNTAFANQDEIDLLKYLYESGYSCMKISQHMHYNVVTVSRRLKLLGYDIKDQRQGNKICQIDVRTKDLVNVFNSTREAGKFLGDTKKAAHISNVLNGKRVSAYGYYWVYYDEYIRNNDMCFEGAKGTKIVCLNTNTLFFTIKEAMLWCNQKNNSGIIACCQQKVKNAGRHPETGELLQWMYYENYAELYDEHNLEEYVA